MRLARVTSVIGLILFVCAGIFRLREYFFDAADHDAAQAHETKSRRSARAIKPAAIFST
jgi:hypothetical protein